MKAAQATKPGPWAANVSRRAHYPGATPTEAVQAEIDRLLRAGYHQNGAGNRDAVTILVQRLRLGPVTARNLWEDAAQQHAAGFMSMQKACSSKFA